MRIYVDTSALVKLVVAEAESSALRRYFAGYPDDTHFSAAIVRTELVRVVARSGSTDIVANARLALAKLDLVAITHALLDVAATIDPPQLRTLDAIHIVGARTAPDLRAMVTYDDRLAEAAVRVGISVVTPA